MADNTFGRVNYLKISRQEKTFGVKFEARKVSWFMSGGENLSRGLMNQDGVKK